jgi:release factor glutamine methyltransferase
MPVLAQATRTALSFQDMTIAQARRTLAEAFRRAGFDTPELDSRILAGHAVGLDHTGLTVEGARRLDGGEAGKLGMLAARRLEREPVARIVGEKEFWGLALRVTEATLVPRPETETVVEAALAAIDSGGSRTRALRIADLGTGSGALLLALLTELPNAWGVGTDISHDALEVARGNADRHQMLTRAQFTAGHFGEALPAGFNLVVSNPPYIASGDIATLAPEVRHDPRRALDGGADGLACYRAIAGDAIRLLAPGGHLVVELGIDQEPAVTSLFQSARLVTASARRDLAGVPRALCAQNGALAP